MVVNEVSLPVHFQNGAAQLDLSLSASGLAAEIRALSRDSRAALSSAVTDRLQGLTDVSGTITSSLISQVVRAVR